MVEILIAIIDAATKLMEGFCPLKYLYSRKYRKKIQDRWQKEKPIIIIANWVGSVLIICLVFFIGYLIAKKNLAG